MKFKRASGILLHPTSLPGDFGIGDFGPAAYEFIDFLRRARQSLWQMLPLGPTGYGDSPYQCYSAFAGNTLLISPEKLVEYGLLDSDQIDRAAVPSKGRVDYGSVTKSKADLLHLTFQNYADGRGAHLREMFHVFMREHAWWLDDYALFRAVREAEGNKPWYEWDEPLRLREPEALTNAANDLSESLLREKFSQYLFFAQYSELQSYAAANDVQLIGDIPIFVALDSSDVWCNQRKFKLHEDGHPKVVSGVPPDYFSKTGQLWGNPIYEWDEMRRDGFHWWVARVAFSLRMFDIVRVDHFRGFSGVWEVPGSDKTAEHGRWADVPGREIFEALRRNLGELPLIAEDLGVITPEVTELRDSFGIPGMKILQFAFGGDAGNQDLPHNYVPNTVAYTGTHDNDTVVGWWNTRAAKGSTMRAEDIKRQKDHCADYLHTNGSEIHWDFIRAAWSSVADTAIAPVQDILGLGSTARMNLPATTSGNWGWRMKKGALTPKIAERLAKITSLYGRARH